MARQQHTALASPAKTVFFYRLTRLFLHLPCMNVIGPTAVSGRRSELTAGLNGRPCSAVTQYAQHTAGDRLTIPSQRQYCCIQDCARSCFIRWMRAAKNVTRFHITFIFNLLLRPNDRPVFLHSFRKPFYIAVLRLDFISIRR